jgi:hypothetical protein
MMIRPRYEDLIWEAMFDLELSDMVQRLSQVHPLAVRERAGEHLPAERAIVSFPNGWALSILRNMKWAHVFADFETCRFFAGCRVGSPDNWLTVEAVQQEMDDVASLGSECVWG